MPNGPVFISHASADDTVVRDLRLALEAQHIPVWVDSRNLRGGDALAPAIQQAIEQARQVLVVLSPRTINSPWVRREIRWALQVEQRRKDAGYRVIPLLCPVSNRPPWNTGLATNRWPFPSSSPPPD